MVEAKAGDAGNQRPLDHVGRIKSTSETNFKDAGIGRSLGEGEEGHRRIDLEQAATNFIVCVECAAHQLGQPRIVDQLAGDADALVVSNQMRAGEGMDPVPRGLEPGTKECAGGALAVRPRDMKDRWQPVLRSS